MRKHWLLRLLAVLFSFTLIASACGDDDGDGDADPVDDGGSDDGGDDDGGDDDGDDGGDDGDDTVDLVQEGGSTLDTIKDRGQLICGVSGAATAFSETQADGSTTGFDADYCRAVAAVITGSADNVEFVALTASERFTALAAGDVDVLFRNTTWTQSRDTDLGGDFGPTTYYDGQQLMGKVADGFDENSTVSDTNGAIVCTNAGTTTEKNMAEAAALEGFGADFGITLNTFEDFNQVTDAFIAGTCDIITTDGSGLVGRRAANDALDDWAIFPATPISKEPLGPMYRQNDSVFADVVNWTVYASIILDELGITSANAQDFVDNYVPNESDPQVGRLLGVDDGELQSGMGLDADAFLNMVTQVGNYDEIFSANLNPVGLVRDGSANARWTEGGLIYAPPAR